MRLRLLAPLALAPLLTACGAQDERFGTAEQAIMICPGASTLQGVDVSHYDGTIDWPTVAHGGISFAFVKATEGVTFTDPMFSTNWPAMQQAGVVRGAYHFFHSTDDPVAQAKLFLQTMGPLQPGDLPPTLDLEVTDNQPADVITSTAEQWLDYVGAAVGLKPILYTGPSFVNGTLGNPAGLQDHAQLWIANWQVSCPDVPAPFTSFAFWQNDDAGTVAGVPGMNNVDTDIFNGSTSDLAALTLPAKATTGAGGSTTTGTGGSGTTGTGGAATSNTGSGGTTSSGPSSTSSDATSTTGSGGGGGSSSGDTNASSGCATAPGSAGAGAWIGALALLALGRRRRRRRECPILHL